MRLFRTGSTAGTLFAATAIATVFSGAAQADGFYLSTFTGLAIQNDQDNTANGQALNVSLDNGFVIGGAIGYKLPVSNFRVELELAYRENDITAGQLLSDPTAAFSGDNSSLGAFANVLYDFDSLPLVTPYIGAGIGVGGVESDVVRTAAVNDLRFGGPTRTEFLYQGIAGVTIPINDTFDLFAEGRYYVAPGVDFDLIDTALNTTTTFNSSYEVIQLQAGLRFKF